MKKFKNSILLTLLMILASGCAGNTVVLHKPEQIENEQVKLVVFLDGTANAESSHTNISKLHKLTTLQPSTQIKTAYIKGVGTDKKFIGMAMGWGIGHDVRQAYRFLGENYNDSRQDKIYIFGFSRGSYAARILSAMIHVAGIQDLNKIPETKRDSYVNKIFSAYKSKKSIVERREDVSTITGNMPKSVSVEFLGLWDTVEALGWPDYKENIDNPNPRYADQLCNIKKAAHAVSIDDDRARIFTPILLTRDHLVAQCNPSKDIDHIVEEVWFSGAHADLGGGYLDTDIDGVSLNWMIKLLAKDSLLPKGTEVYANPYGKTHNPENGLWGLIYHRMNRSLDTYTDSSSYNNGRLKIHKSVLDRLVKITPEWYESSWYESDKYKHCFQKNEKGIDYIKSENCFDVIDY